MKQLKFPGQNRLKALISKVEHSRKSFIFIFHFLDEEGGLSCFEIAKILVRDHRTVKSFVASKTDQYPRAVIDHS